MTSADPSPSPSPRPRRRRTYGSGSIRKRGPNRWELRVRIPDPVTGGSRQVSRIVRGTEHEAKKALKEIAVDGAGLLGPPTVTMLEVIKHYLKLCGTRGREKKTIYNYAKLWEYVEDELGPLNPEAITPTWMDDYFERLVKEGVGKPTVVAIRRLLRAAGNAAVDKRMIAHHPFAAADVPAHKPKKTESTSTDVLRAVFEAACKIDLPVAIGVRLSAVLGSRRGETAAEAWTDIDWDQRDIRRHRSAGAVPEVMVDDLVLPGTDGTEVTETKTKADNRHPLDDDTLALLARWRDEREAQCAAAGIPFNESGFILSPELDGSRPINPDVLSDRLRAVAKTVTGGEGVGFRQLRMWAATEIEARHGLAVAQSRLDHRNSGTTARYYLGRDVEAEQAAADDLGETLGPVPEEPK